MRISSLTIPYDFASRLPELKDKAFKWRTQYSTGGKDGGGTYGTLTHYSISDKPYGSFVLAPGLASNTSIEPMMRAITYWSLTHRYNVYCIDTFLGNFLPAPSLTEAKKNTFAEYIKSFDTGMDLLEQHFSPIYTCLIGHSAGATGAIEIFNKRIQQGKKPRVSAAILFAPYVSKEWHTNIQKIYKSRYKLENISDEEFNAQPMSMVSPHNTEPDRRYVSVMPQIFADMDNIEFRPELMDQWGIQTTIVGGGRDRKAPIENLREIYDTLQTMPNGKNFRFVEFPDARHSFITQYRDWPQILKLIKSQRLHVANMRGK